MSSLTQTLHTDLGTAMAVLWCVGAVAESRITSLVDSRGRDAVQAAGQHFHNGILRKQVVDN